MYELDFIFDAGTGNPFIDTTAFPATPEGAFWHSTSNPVNSSEMWHIAFYSVGVAGAISGISAACSIPSKYFSVPRGARSVR